MPISNKSDTRNIVTLDSRVQAGRLGVAKATGVLGIEKTHQGWGPVEDSLRLHVPKTDAT